MRIWVDGQALQTGSMQRGIGRYIVQFLSAIKQNHPEYRIQISFNAALAEEIPRARDIVADIVAPEDVFIWESVADKGEYIEGLDDERLLSELLIANHVASIVPDVAISASPFEGAFDKAVPLLSKFGHDFSIVSIFYDAIPLRYPDKYLSNPLFEKAYQRRLNSYKNFDHNLTISDFSNKELRSILKVKNTTPIYAGVSEIFSREMLESIESLELKEEAVGGSIQDVPRKEDIPYILYIGGLDWRKNVEIVVDAFNTKALRQHSRIKFYVAGDSYEAEEDKLRKRWRSYGLKDDDLNIIGHVTDEALVELYKNAEIVVQPSYMEGFGLTALEAIACKTAVLVSNQGALPEIVANSTLLFQPSDHDDLASKILFLLNNPKKTEEMVAANTAHVEHLTWKNTAAIASKVLHKIARKKRLTIKSKNRDIITLAAAKNIPLDIKIKTIGLANSEVQPPSERRLLVDVTSTTRVNHGTGIQRVVNSICDNLLKKSNFEEDVIFTYADSSDRFRVVNKKISEPFHLTKNRPRNQLDIAGTDTVLMLDSSWEFHASYKVQLNSARIKGADIITTLYDLVPIRTPAFCNGDMPIVFSGWLRDALEYSTGFVCISKAIADELIVFLNGIKFPRPMKIGFWHLGADFSANPANLQGPLKEEGASKFLMVGTLEPRKGHSVVLSAFEKMWKEGLSHELTIVGKPGWNMDAFISKLDNHSELGKKLFVETHVSDAQLQKFYLETDALISASFAEGFGLPLVEAAHFDKPIIASDIPVFREVSKGADASFFECGNPVDLMRAVKKFKSRKSASTKDKLQAYKSLSWEESTQALMDVVLNGRWYHHYEADRNQSGQENSLGILIETTDLADQPYAIELVQSFVEVTNSGEMQCIVKIINQSDRPWASLGPDGAESKGIMIGCRIEDHLGGLEDKKIRTKIPLSMVPGLPYYFSVTVSKDDYRGGNVFHIELLQEGVRWWGNSLVIKKSS